MSQRDKVYAEAIATQVVVETQERKLAEDLTALGAEVKVMSLKPEPAGDLAFIAGGRFVGGELKSASDLLSSWVGRRMRCKPSCPRCNGKGCQRLDSQLSRMLDNYDHVILFVHGWFGVTSEGYINLGRRTPTRLWDGLWNALFKWQARGVCLDFSTSRSHLAKRVLSLNKYIEKRARADLLDSRRNEA